MVSLATLPNFVPKEMALRKVEVIKATARAMAGNEEVSESGSHIGWDERCFQLDMTSLSPV